MACGECRMTACLSDSVFNSVDSKATPWNKEITGICQSQPRRNQMNKDNKKGTANTPKRLTVQDLKKILGGLGSNVMAITVEDKGGSKASPNVAE
jgi:hypothetical protein